MIKEKTYDIILLDINLGVGMNGIQLAKEIRENQYDTIYITMYNMKFL